MPLLEITTNCSLQNADQLASKASKATAEILGKPESYVMVKVQPVQTLFFAGSGAPAAHMKLKSLGLPEERTAEYSEKLCQLMSDNTGIDSSRIYIEFASPERHMWGWDGRTF
jgi:phenylpyruvate tautomerase PptA (4-oxalocrotonate tautomerase family)